MLGRRDLRWDQLNDPGSIDPYVRRVVVTCIIDEGRRGWFRREAPLAQVPPRQRAVLVLRYWEDQSVEQVAVLLDCAPGTVKSQTARGLERLRRLLGDRMATQAEEADGQIREILARALFDRPLTTSITREAAVAAGRRALRRRRQRLQVLVAGALATLALGAGAPPMIAQIGSGAAIPVPIPSAEPTASPSTSPAAAPSPIAGANPGPPPARPMPVKTPTGVAVQLSGILRTGARTLLPYAVFGSNEVGFDDATYLVNPLDVIDNGHGYYIALAQIVNESRVGTLSVGIWPGDDGRKAPSSGCTAGFAPDCQTRVGPSGSRSPSRPDSGPAAPSRSTGSSCTGPMARSSPV